MKTRVVVIDDNRLIRTGIVSLLKAESCDVVAEAETARDGLIRVAELNPDVVVMDARLPDTSGIEATAQIVARHPNVKVLMLSAHGDNDLVAQAMDAGASGFVLKDVAFEELGLAVTRIMAGEIHISPSLGGE